MPSKHQVTALLLAKAWEGRRASTGHGHALDANPKRAFVVHVIEHVLVLDDANPPTPGQPRCRSTPGAITALPLAKRWFTHDVNEVVQQINRFSTPVALMAEDRDDPFASTKAISGLIRLLDDARVPVLLLRCDVTAIGTLAFGASHAAIGTTTGLRHIWPPTDKGGFRLPAIAAFVPKAMSYRTLPNIGYAVLHYPDDQVRWRCDCDVCAGSTLDHLADEDEAAMHSLLCLSDLTQAVLQDPSLAAQAWIERCRHALSINQEVAAALVKNWPTPGNLDAWVSAVG